MQKHPRCRRLMNWPTPKSTLSGPDFARAEREGSGGDDLATAAARFPTPTANRRSGLQSHGVNVVTGQLNPEFVEWLQGYAMNWTNMDKASILRYGKKKESRSDQALRDMPDTPEEKTVQREMGRHGRLHQTEVLRPGVYGQGADGGEPRERREEIQTPTETIMRDLRDYRESGRASQGQELEQQRPFQFDDAVQFLSHIIASCTGRHHDEEREAAVLRLRQAVIQTWSLLRPPESTQEIWESISDEEKDWTIISACRGPWHAEIPTVTRLATGQAERVNRLRGLGNSIVPQIAELIFRQIKENQ